MKKHEKKENGEKAGHRIKVTRLFWDQNWYLDNVSPK